MIVTGNTLEPFLCYALTPNKNACPDTIRTGVHFVLKYLVSNLL